MSKAEERRAEWLSRQYAADRASTLDVADINARKARADAHAAAEKAVVKAAMAWYEAAPGGCSTHAGAEAHLQLCDACLALKKLEADK